MNKMTYREALQRAVATMRSQAIYLDSHGMCVASRIAHDYTRGLESMLEDIELEPYLDRIALSGTSVSETKPEAGVGRKGE